MEFASLIKRCMNKREKHILNKQSMVIEMDSKIAKIFLNSQNVSGMANSRKLWLVEKGKSHKLLRKAVLRGKKINEEFMEKEVNEADRLIPDLKNEIDKLRSEIQLKDFEIEEAAKERDILAKLYDLGS